MVDIHGRRVLRRASIGLLLFSSILLFTGCLVKPQPLSDQDRFARSLGDLEALFEGQEAVEQPLQFSDVLARALKYNMDHRVKLMELAVASRQLDMATMDLLPSITAEAGYTSRNNDPGSSSISLLSGRQSLEPSRSQDRSFDTENITIAWNVLDFGISYLTAKQRSDEILIAEERRRKVTQNVMQDVIEAFWRAWAAQELTPEVATLMQETDEAIRRSKILVKQQTQGKKQALAYQRVIMEIRAHLWTMQEQMGLAKTRLAALMNLKPGTNYTLVATDRQAMPRGLKNSLKEVERQALRNRPELREEDYRLRISQLDVQKAFLHMFPGVHLTAGWNRDGNSLIFNNNWYDVGVSVAWNLVKAVGAFHEKSWREAEVMLADTRRLSLSMAVLTQVHLSVQRLELARHRYVAAKDLSDVNQDFYEVVEQSPGQESRFEKIRAKAAALASRMRENLAYAETQASIARVFNSLGLNPIPESVASHDLEPLSEALGVYWQDLQNQYLAAL